MQRRRVLFMAEAITLAQVVRLVQLARALDTQKYEVHFAASTFEGFIFDGTDFTRHALHSVSAAKAMARVDAGKSLYTERILRSYVESDLSVIDAVKPARVVGDLRWSLPVSAPARKVPLASLINAYWSPFASRPDGFPLPDHPIVSVLGDRIAREYFPKALPKVMDTFAKPVNRLRERHGLPPIGGLLEVLTYGDATLYADPPGLAPLLALPESHHLLGPVLWAPNTSLPPSWGEDETQVPIYMTLGSSGALGKLKALLDVLASLKVDVLWATADRLSPKDCPPNVRPVPYAPGDKACAKAHLTITNGGSSTGYQALAAGCPVLGIYHDLDQALATQAIERADAGLGLRAGALTKPLFETALQRLLSKEKHSGAAQIAAAMATTDAAEMFRRIVDDMTA